MPEIAGLEWDARRFSRDFRELTGGDTQENIGLKLGYTAGRIGQVQRGQRPSREFIERLIDAYGVDRKEWLEKAGYRPGVPDPTVDETVVRSVEEALRRAGLGAKTGSEVLLEGIDALRQERGKPLRISFHGQIRAGLSVEEAEELLATIRQQAQEGLFD